MRGVRRTATTATAVLLGLSTAACSSSTTQNTAKSTSSPTTTATHTDLGYTNPSPSPLGSHCPAPAGTEVIYADGTTTVNGTFAVTGYVETAECGPNVPDDVIYQNTGTHRSFALPSGIKVTLTGSDGVHPRTATLADLEALLQNAFGSKPSARPVTKGVGLGSHYFSLTLGADGEVTGIESIYIP
jgi:hypothetical protein